jgi:hypothetical protein
MRRFLSLDCEFGNPRFLQFFNRSGGRECAGILLGEHGDAKRRNVAFSVVSQGLKTRSFFEFVLNEISSKRPGSKRLHRRLPQSIGL